MHERTTDAAETAVPLPDDQARSYTPGASEQGRAMTSVEAGRLAGRPAVAREPLGRVERLQLAVLAGMFVLLAPRRSPRCTSRRARFTMFVLLAAMLSAGAIAFTSLSGQILGLQEQIGGIHGEIGGIHGGLRRDPQRSAASGLRAEMHEEIGALRAEMREEIGELSERMTRIETLLETHLVPASDARDPAGP